MKRFLVISDVEATCDLSSPGAPPPEHEVLEFPFLLCDLSQPGLPVLEQRRFFCRPVRTTVTAFCTGLTGITSDFIEREGRPLQEVVWLIEEAIGAERAKDAVLCFDGPWDLSLLQKEFADKKIVLRHPQLWQSFIDLKTEFRRAFPVAEFPESNFHPVPSLNAMKRFVRADKGLTAHQGLDDCLQIHAILEKMLQKPGFQLSGGQPYDPKHQSKSFNDLFTDALTVPQLLHALDFAENDVLAVFCAPHLNGTVRSTSSLHILPGSSTTLRSYVCVMTDAYQAQVFMMRGNLSVQCYNKSHWESQLERNLPSLLSCVFYSDVLKCDPAQLAQWRSFLCYTRLLETLRDTGNYLTQDAARCEKKGIMDVPRQRRAALAVEIAAAAQLIGAAGQFFGSEQLDQLLNAISSRIHKAPASLAAMLANPQRHGVVAEPPNCKGEVLLRNCCILTPVARTMMHFECLVLEGDKPVAAVGPQPTSGRLDSSGHLQEALVGTPCSLYCRNGEWRVVVARRFRSFPNPTFNYSPDSLVDEALFWKLFGKCALPPAELQHCCFAFIVSSDDQKLRFEFAFETPTFKPLQNFNPALLEWPIARRMAMVDEEAPPTVSQGCWHVSPDGAVRQIVPSRAFVSFRTALALGNFHPDTVEHVMTALLFVRDGNWFKTCNLSSVFARCKSWLDAKLAATDKEYTAKRYLPSAAYLPAVQESPVRNWLVEMRKDVAKDTRSFLMARVPPKILAMMWKKDQFVARDIQMSDA